MHVQYSSANRLSSDFCVTLLGSGQGDWGSGVTFDPCLCTVLLVGVQMGVGFSGELVCWASLDLEKTTGQLVTDKHRDISQTKSYIPHIPFSPKQFPLFLQTERTASSPSILWYCRRARRQAKRGGREAALRFGVRPLCTYRSWVDSP